MSAARASQATPAARAAALGPLAALLLGLAGCQGPPGPVFPGLPRPIVWPPPPDPPRIRYVGALYGEASLNARLSGWQRLRAALAGPRPAAEFARPVAVAVAGDRVYVADVGLGLVHRLDLAARQYAAIRGAPGDPLRVPVDVAIAPDGTLLVVDRGRAAIDVLDADGGWLRTDRRPELAAPVALAWDAGAGVWWVADVAAHAALAWRPEDGVLRAFGGRGYAPGRFNYPAALAWHPRVGLVVADAMNFRVQVFTAGDQPAAVFGKKGDAAGDFARPRGVAIDSAGHVYVVDNQFENIQVFDAAGRLLLAFGEGGAGPGQFSLPAGITVDAEDRIWVADSYNRRVQVFQYLAEGE